MGNTKTEFKWFTVPQYREEEEYLSNMHAKGWKLTKVTFPGFYHFVECEPEHVSYRLDYNQEGVANKGEYIQMFSDCGWEYLFDFVGYSYFRKACKEGDAGDEIFCDDESRLDMMKRVFKGRVIPLIVIFFCIIFPQLTMHTSGISVIFFYLGLLYLVLFGLFAIQFYQYEKRVKSENRNVNAKYAGIFGGIGFCFAFLFFIMVRFYLSDYELIDRKNGFTIEAERLNKCIEKEYELKKGDKIMVSPQFENGRLKIEIGQQDKDPIFTGEPSAQIGDFSVVIQEDGNYRIECEGKRAKGNISFFIE